MEKFELNNNTKEEKMASFIDKEWENESKAWEDFVKNKLWPAYKKGVDEIAEQFEFVRAVLSAKLVDKPRAKEVLTGLEIIGFRALEEFDKLSEEVNHKSDKRSPIYYCIHMVNHRGRKYFIAAVDYAGLFNAWLEDPESNKKPESQIDEANLLSEEYFLKVLGIGSVKKMELTDFLEDFTGGVDKEKKSIYNIQVDGPLEAQPVRFMHRLLVTEIVKEFINNAKEEMPGGGDIVVGGSKENGTIVLYVKDNGPGIELEMQDKIFQPKTGSREHGTGMGLYRIKRIVEEYLKGTIKVESEPGKGAKFTISFPEAKK